MLPFVTIFLLVTYLQPTASQQNAGHSFQNVGDSNARKWGISKQRFLGIRQQLPNSSQAEKPCKFFAQLFSVFNHSNFYSIIKFSARIPCNSFAYKLHTVSYAHFLAIVAKVFANFASPPGRSTKKKTACFLIL